MTGVQYIEYLLENNWTKSVSGRPHDVGQLVVNGGYVKMVRESDKDWRQMALDTYDYITIRDGGISDMTPQSFGWQQEDSVTRIDIDIRTKGWPNKSRPGRIALYGERGAGTLNANEAPRWGGLVGETLRVLKSVRTGDQEWSLVNATEADDLSSQMGGHVWRSVVGVRLEQRSRTIDTST